MNNEGKYPTLSASPSTAGTKQMKTDEKINMNRSDGEKP